MKSEDLQKHSIWLSFCLSKPFLQCLNQRCTGPRDAPFKPQGGKARWGLPRGGLGVRGSGWRRAGNSLQLSALSGLPQLQSCLPRCLTLECRSNGRGRQLTSLTEQGVAFQANLGPLFWAVLAAGLSSSWVTLRHSYNTIGLLSLLNHSSTSFPSQVPFLNKYFIPQIHFGICFQKIQAITQTFLYI